MALAQAPHADAGAGNISGLARVAFEADGRTLLGHDGHTTGFSSGLVLDRERHLAVAVLASVAVADVTGMAVHAIAPDWQIRVPPVPDERTPAAVPIEVLRPYLGTYALPDADVTLAVTDGGKGVAARVDSGDPIPLVAAGPAELFVADMGTTITFERDAAGTVTGLVLHQLGEDLHGTRVADP